MRQRPPTKQSARCSCAREQDTPTWVGARTSGSGLSTRHATDHGNPYRGTGACVHDELQRTTRAKRPQRTVVRIRVLTNRTHLR